MSRTKVQHLEERAKDAVARCLGEQLTLPRIYFDAQWPTKDRRTDLLAIDRDGSGEMHVVEISHAAKRVLERIPRLLEIPAPFRWVAYFLDTCDDETHLAIADRLFPADSMGRIGVIKVASKTDELEAFVAMRAERFPFGARQQVADFVAGTQADIQYDESDPIGTLGTDDKALLASEIHKRLAKVLRLANGGEKDAAFLLAWSGLEAAMRLASERHSLPVDGRSPATLIRSLLSVGLLDEKEHQSLSEAMQVRNSLIHGFKPKVRSGLSVRMLANLTRRLLKTQRTRGRAKAS